MNIFETIIMGLVQGVTEFIPVSSSGHLVLTETLFGQEASHLFIQSLDFGTLFALVIFFRKRLIDLARRVFIKRDFRLLRNLILTALPVAIAGLALSHVIENSHFLNSPVSVSIALFVIGAVMIALNKFPKLSAKRDGTDLSARRAIGIGVAQTLALVPGVSRSGSTIIAGRIAGLSARAAAEYSFMVSIPVMAGLVAKLLAANHEYLITNWQAVLIGNLAAFVAGILAIRFMIEFLSRHGLAPFGWYRVILAAVFLVGLAIL